MHRTIPSRLRAFSAAGLLVLAMTGGGALAGGMPPEVEIDANGVPVEATAAGPTATPALPAAAPAEGVVLASDAIGDKPKDAPAAALAAPGPAASGFAMMMRDHR